MSIPYIELVADPRGTRSGLVYPPIAIRVSSDDPNFDRDDKAGAYTAIASLYKLGNRHPSSFGRNSVYTSSMHPALGTGNQVAFIYFDHLKIQEPGTYQIVVTVQQETNSGGYMIANRIDTSTFRVGSSGHSSVTLSKLSSWPLAHYGDAS